MIVRDEARIIERLLTSVRGLIDTWVICDTGSTDGTQELIRGALADVPGTLHERPWVDFGHNRSELMELASGAADYLLLLDADMTVSLEGTLPRLDADSYLLRHREVPEYWIKRLVRGDRAWRYVGSTHEYLEAADGAPESTEQLPQIVIDHHADSGTRAEKFDRDKRLLTQEIERDPSAARAVFYLAQTHRDLGEIEQAIELYARRAEMGGWDEEVFYALYQVGVLRAQLGDWPQAMADLVRAWEYRPARLEPLYELASRLRMRGEYETAHVLVARGLGRARPPDVLFVSAWLYEWGFLFEYSITAYWTGDVKSALAACDQLLSRRDLPDEHRQQTIVNKRYCLERLAERMGEEARSRSASRVARR